MVRVSEARASTGLPTAPLADGRTRSATTDQDSPARLGPWPPGSLGAARHGRRLGPIRKPAPVSRWPSARTPPAADAGDEASNPVTGSPFAERSKTAWMMQRMMAKQQQGG